MSVDTITPPAEDTVPTPGADPVTPEASPSSASTDAPDSGHGVGLLGQAGEGEPKDPESPTPEGEEGKTDEGEKKEGEGAPEAYELTMPEGMELDAELLKELTPIAQANNLSQEAVQQFADLHAKGLQQQREALSAEFQKNSEAVYEQQLEEWQNQIKALPNHEKMLADGLRAVERFAPDEDVARELGGALIGNNPSFVRFVAAIGKAIGEDSFLPGARGSDAGNKKSAKDFYNKSNMND